MIVRREEEAGAGVEACQDLQVEEVGEEEAKAIFREKEVEEAGVEVVKEKKSLKACLFGTACSWHH